MEFQNRCRAVEDNAGRKPEAGDPQFFDKNNAYQKEISDCANAAMKKHREQPKGK